VIIDPSALLAIILREADGDRYLDAIPGSDQRHMSVVNRLEATMVIEGRGDTIASSRFDEFFGMAAICLLPVSFEQAMAARQSWRSFGRGNRKAALNFGDCFAYGAAKAEGQPLLFKGNDFPQTDIKPALKA
jgi:ribonuclease VapC